MHPVRKFLWLAVLAVALLPAGTKVTIGAAQVLNPLYVQARNLWQQMSASSIAVSTKAEYGRRFGDLANEQRRLWQLAAQVDARQCSGACLNSYNNSVVAWQANLAKFNGDIQNALATLLPQPGKWQPYGDAIAMEGDASASCWQAWICVPAEQFMAAPNMKVVSTPVQRRHGVCSADSSNPKECGTCNFLDTLGRCEWHLEPK